MKIYKLTNTENGMIYIGQTTQKLLSTRKGQHKYSSVNNIKTCSSKKLYDNCIDVKNIKIELLEELSTSSTLLGGIRERYYINLYPECVNERLRN